MQLFELALIVFVLGGGLARKAGGCGLGVVAGDANLRDERQHVRSQPSLHEVVDVEAARLSVFVGLVEDRVEVLQRARELANGESIHGLGLLAREIPSQFSR